MIPLDKWDSEMSECLTALEKEQIARLSAVSHIRSKPKHISSLGETKPSPCYKVETSIEFEKWFDSLNILVEDDLTAKLRSKYEEARRLSEYCGELQGRLTQFNENIKELNTTYKLTTDKTKSFYHDCEQLLENQQSLVQESEEISSKLSYFTEYDSIMQKLNSSHFSTTNETCSTLLIRIDECTHFLQDHPQYKETPHYLNLYKHAQSKAFQLIKENFKKTMETAVAQSPNKNQNILESESFSIFYGRFRAIAPKLKLIMEQVEQRAETHLECKQMVEDCQTLFVNIRNNLVGLSVSNALDKLVDDHKQDHCGLFRTGCAMILQVCNDERQLFNYFFTDSSSPRLSVFLDKLCSYLYDQLRPIIIHVIHLETLSELCSILKNEIIEDKVARSEVVCNEFESMCRQLLEDVQERLVYRTQMYIKSDILNYRPATGDLAYPEKLEMMRDIASNLKHKRLPSTVSDSSEMSEDSKEVLNIIENDDNDVSPADMHGMWYPTLRRTLVCLSKLYRCLDKDIFQGLSQEALKNCIESLRSAANYIRQKKTPTESQLFFIKHLLILREQIQPFHAEFAIQETSLDFSKTKNAAFNLIQGRQRLFSLNSNNSLLEFLVDGSPNLTVYMVDSKKAVDQNLKSMCEEFVTHSVKILCTPLQHFLTKANLVLELKRDGQTKVNLGQQPFFAPEKIQDVFGATNKDMNSKLPVLRKNMSLFLSNRETEAILFKPIQNRIQQLFADVSDLLNKFLSHDDLLIIGVPSSEQLNLMLSNN